VNSIPAAVLSLVAGLVFGWLVGALVDVVLTSFGVFAAGTPAWYFGLLVLDGLFAVWVYRVLRHRASQPQLEDPREKIPTIREPLRVGPSLLVAVVLVALIATGIGFRLGVQNRRDDASGSNGELEERFGACVEEYERYNHQILSAMANAQASAAHASRLLKEGRRQEVANVLNVALRTTEAAPFGLDERPGRKAVCRGINGYSEISGCLTALRKHTDDLNVDLAGIMGSLSGAIRFGVSEGDYGIIADYLTPINNTYELAVRRTSPLQRRPCTSALDE
jgi:hypothetical protein